MNTLRKKISYVFKTFFIFLVRVYQVILSPLKGGRTCVFDPTCSEYTRQAIERYGVFRGIWLGLKRILRCHPFQKKYYDPVP